MYNERDIGLFPINSIVVLLYVIRDDFDKVRRVHRIAKTKRVVLFNRIENIEIFHA